MDSEKSAAITEVELTPDSAISVSDLKQDLTTLTPEYKGMLDHIEETLPATNAADNTGCMFFKYKKSSPFAINIFL